MGTLIYSKVIEVMKEVGVIGKDQKNTAQGFKFRGIDQVMNALYPALTKHGVVVAPECVVESHQLQEVTRSSGKVAVDKHVHLQMKFHLFAEDGSYMTLGPVPGEGLDSGDKATNKALSAAFKYAILQSFCIPTEDVVDGDAESPEITPQTTDKTTTERTPEQIKSSFKRAQPKTETKSTGDDF